MVRDLPSNLIVTVFGVRRVISVAVSGNRVERETLMDLSLPYPSAARASSTVPAVVP